MLKKHTQTDWYFCLIVSIQKLLLITLLIFRFTPKKITSTFIITIIDLFKPGLIYINIYLIIVIIINLFVIIKVFYFNKKIKSIKKVKILLIILGFLSLHCGLLTLIIALMLTENRMHGYKYMHSSLLKSKKTKKYGLLISIGLILLFSSYLLVFKVLREPMPSEYQIRFIKTTDEPGIYFYGQFHLKELDDNITLITPDILPFVHKSHFPENIDIYMNYYLNERAGHELDVNYNYSAIKFPVLIIDQNIGDLVKDISVVFKFYYKYEDEDVILEYELNEDDYLNVYEIKPNKKKWIWE